jgi:2-hydroxychromene-2-carboxylate isomerase
MDVVSIERYRLAAARRHPSGRRVGRPTFYFDVQSPYTYLAAERVDRMFAGLQWVPASLPARGGGAVTCELERAAIAARAALLGLPLVWPVEPAVAGPGAMRVASLAVERGVGAEFVLAASRLVFCGGYSVEDPEILAEAAAAAGIDWREMLDAVGDAERDVAIEEVGRRLVAAGADRLPALRVGRTLFCGEDRLGEAAAARPSA